MAHYSKIFHKVPVDIPNKSGFDMSHTNLFTAQCGTLVPSLVEPLLPNDTVSLDVFSQIQLPPMATDFYGSVKAKFEVFFVPYRLLYGGWQEVITRSTTNRTGTGGNGTTELIKYLPSISIPAASAGPASLADYLGCKTDASSGSVYIPNILPFVAYHKIYDDWYRESRIQTELFDKSKSYGNSLGTGSWNVSFLPYSYAAETDGDAYNLDASTSAANFKDGVNITSLRQRNWQKDYFTNSTPLPQSGLGASLGFNVDSNGGTASFTIAALRAANSLQRYMERNNIAGFRYADQIKATYGIYPSDAVLDRSIYLGSHTIPVYTKSVFQQSNTAPTDSKNPFGTIGTKYGSSQGVGDGELIGKFTAEEHGFLFVMFSLVPDLQYSSGTRRYLMETSQADIPNPLLQGVGDQPIYQSEITGAPLALNSTSPTFGYTQRYAHYKYHDDEVHGLLRDGQNLSAFALQMSYSSGSNATINTDFLQIPVEYLDQVMAVSSSESGYACWVQCGFRLHKSSTLSAYDIPTLGDLRNVHTEVIDNGGRRL